MFDREERDSNSTPREGSAIFAQNHYGHQEAWGALQGSEFGAHPALYFRDAVHEIGHAMGLLHRYSSSMVDGYPFYGFMSTSDVMVGVRAIVPPRDPFPGNVQWTFALEDQIFLAHAPDIVVRPGGTPFPFQTEDRFDALPLDGNEWLRIEIIERSEKSADLRLTNKSKSSIFVPATLESAYLEFEPRECGCKWVSTPAICRAELIPLLPGKTHTLQLLLPETAKQQFAAIRGRLFWWLGEVPIAVPFSEAACKQATE